MATPRKNAKTSASASGLPQLGQEWPGLPGSTFAGISTDKLGAIYALVLLADKPASRLNWQAGMAWAAKLGADLPSRPESALLFANVPDKFEKTWHWTNEQYSEGDAWSQDFCYGYQGRGTKSYEASVRAVRRFVLGSFDPFNGLKDRATQSVAQLRALAQTIDLACDAVSAAAEAVPA